MFSDAIILINSRLFINTSGLFAFQYLRIEILISLVIGQIRFFSLWIYIFKISLIKLLKELDDVNPPGRVSDTSRLAGLWGWMGFLHFTHTELVSQSISSRDIWQDTYYRARKAGMEERNTYMTLCMHASLPASYKLMLDPWVSAAVGNALQHSSQQGQGSLCYAGCKTAF